jgi:hypothetical protein
MPKAARCVTSIDGRKTVSLLIDDVTAAGGRRRPVAIRRRSEAAGKRNGCRCTGDHVVV